MTDFKVIEQIKLTIQDLLNQAGFNAVVSYEDSIVKGLVFNISSRESRRIIGRQGNTLEALETICRALIARNFPEFDQKFSLDVDDYKIKREWMLKENLRQSVETLKSQRKPIILEDMPRHDRRFLHRYIQDNYPDIKSYSEGREPRRHMVISLNKNTAT